MKRVAIVISSYNQLELLKQSLISIRKTDYPEYKVFVVDDSGKEEIGLRIKEQFKDVHVILNEYNFGFSGAYNIGIRTAIKEYNPNYVLVLNDDIEITDKDWLKKLVEFGEENTLVGIIGCRINYPDGSLQNMGGFMRGWKIDSVYEQINYEFEVDYIMGAFMLIKKGVIEDIGLFDEKFNPYLLEDTDYCLRAKKEGWSIYSIPYVNIIHKKGKSINSSTDEPKRLLVRFKNDIIFSRKHLTGFNKFFRIFVYLPFVAVLKKKNDTDELKFSKFVLRKNPIKNLYMWSIAFFPSIYKKKIK